MENYLVELFWQYRLANLYDALAQRDATNNQVNNTPDQTTAPTAGGKTAHSSFAEIIKEASSKFGVSEQVISAVINQESSYNANAVSSCGAQGLMQLMPRTAASLGVKDAFNPEENIMAGTKYLKEKLDEFGGNLEMALAAYNAGSGAVKRHHGVPPYKETQKYVSRIMNSLEHTV